MDYLPLCTIYIAQYIIFIPPIRHKRPIPLRCFCDGEAEELLK